MKVSISWLKELVDLKVSLEELVTLIPMRTIGLKEVTSDFIELDMKGYNRADLLSMRGVAREVAAITESDLVGPESETYEVGSKNLPKNKVQVVDENLCPVYCIAKVENLKVEGSPDTWVKKLSDSGMRTVNNVADVTNLVMLEYGQPMHSFDADKITDQTLIVRLATPGETLQTLDGKTRQLDKTDLVIADPEKPLGIAGVMGGKDCEASNSTTTILLEAAIFDPISIRQTAQRHNLRSEASKRFQHGLTKTNLLQALSAAIKMYESLGGKLTAISLVGNLEDKPKIIQLTQEKVDSLIGVQLTNTQVEQSLQKLGFTLKREGANVNHLEGGVAWHVLPPYWRLDINIEEDLIEEVARIYGYEKIPHQKLQGKIPEKIDQKLPNFIYNLKRALADAGLTEVQTYSFYSTQILDNLGYDKPELIKVANPISSETEYLRNHLWPNLVEVVGKNMRNGYKDIAIFEIGKAYMPGPKESYRLTIALMNGSDNPIEELLSVIARNVMMKQSSNMKKIAMGSSSPRNDEEEILFHPTRFAPLELNGKPIGKIGEVHPRVLSELGIENRIAILEIDLESLI